MHNAMKPDSFRSVIASSKAKLCAAALFVLGVSGAAMGQADWPNHPVTLLVPYSAGSASDTLARTLIGPIGRKIGQPIII